MDISPSDPWVEDGNLYIIKRHWLMRSILLLVLCSLLAAVSPWVAFGQIPSGGPPMGPPGLGPIEPSQRSGDVPEFQEKAKPPKPTPPPTEIVPKPDLPPLEEEQEFPRLRMRIDKILIEGNTIVSEAELDEVIKDFEGRVLGNADLQALRQRISQLYAEKGYINSGAVIPDQTVEDGSLIIHILEGEITDIEIAGTKHFWDFYFKDRLGLGIGYPFLLDHPLFTENRNEPFNIETLRQRLQLILQDPSIKRLNAEIIPGLQRGADTLRVEIEEASPYYGWLEFNNFQNPSVGAERGILTLQHLNLLGLGDTLRFIYGRSAGTDPLAEVFYELPFTRWDTTLQARFRRTDYRVVEGPFSGPNFDIDLDTDIYGVLVRQPIYRTVTQEFALSAQFEYLNNQNFLNGRGFPFFEGSSPDGKQVISALRFIQEWIERIPGQVISIRNRFSVGIDALGATIEPGSDVTGQFFVWLGQAQWGKRIAPFDNILRMLDQEELARRFERLNIQLISRLDVQLAANGLFPLEQFAMGGRFSVRGYRENTLVRDNALLVSFESRIPAWQTALGQDILQIAPFADVGRSWNTGRPSPTTEVLASIGLGTLWYIPQLPGSTFQVYWGLRLNSVPNPHDNLQDYGLHVQMTYQALPLSGPLEELFRKKSPE